MIKVNEEYCPPLSARAPPGIPRWGAVNDRYQIFPDK